MNMTFFPLLVVVRNLGWNGHSFYSGLFIRYLQGSELKSRMKTVGMAEVKGHCRLHLECDDIVLSQKIFFKKLSNIFPDINYGGKNIGMACFFF